jgi:hypothetical protein
LNPLGYLFLKPQTSFVPFGVSGLRQRNKSSKLQATGAGTNVSKGRGDGESVMQRNTYVGSNGITVLQSGGTTAVRVLK